MVQDITLEIIRSSRKSLSIRVLPDGSLRVNAPRFASELEIHNFINKQHEWIERQRQKILTIQAKRQSRRYEDGEEFLYLGNTIRLAIGDHKAILLQGDRLCFPHFLKFRIREEIRQWFIKQAKDVIADIVRKNSQVMNVSYSSITFSDTRSKWGSCTRDNRLQFCWRLVMAPLLVIQYVVIHELVHIIEKNHSRKFWMKVALYNPSYKQQIQWLKTHGDELAL
ncbi:MAG: M48 family metallopeptidase [Patescibacteria group bacterium]|nr:M48 family metallopeptidase [Patescibacteria group bacterium]